MKRVILDGAVVANVAAISAGSPAGTGSFLDVADGVRVGPGYGWNGSMSAPVFTPCPVSPFGNPMAMQTAAVATAGGVARVTWERPFSDVPVPIGCVVFDPAGGRYDCTLTENTAASMAFAVSRQRPLPNIIASLGSLVGYDTYTAAPDGLTVYLAAKVATQ